jgi:hypothetical protein
MVHTRSSPTGPAEHEEGGSLWNEKSQFPDFEGSTDTILPAEVSEFLVNSLESHDESDRTKRTEGGQRTIFRAGVGNTYGYVFVWKREKRREEERGGKWAGECLWCITNTRHG